MFAKMVAFKARLMLLIALILVGYNVQPAQAFNAADYQGLADATSSATIPPGTTITVENWQQYKQFIPVGLQWLYGGKYYWKVPSEPTMESESVQQLPFPRPTNLQSTPRNTPTRSRWFRCRTAALISKDTWPVCHFRIRPDPTQVSKFSTISITTINRTS
jgi:hypothetical protein